MQDVCRFRRGKGRPSLRITLATTFIEMQRAEEFVLYELNKPFIHGTSTAVGEENLVNYYEFFFVATI